MFDHSQPIRTPDTDKFLTLALRKTNLLQKYMQRVRTLSTISLSTATRETKSPPPTLPALMEETLSAPPDGTQRQEAEEMTMTTDIKQSSQS